MKGAVLGGKASTRAGIPSGETRKSIKRARTKARVQAQEKVKLMADELGIDLDEDKAAKAALEFAVEVIETDKDGTAVKLAAARLILDFTKKKPATSGEIKLNAAEEFLAALAEKEA